MTQLLANDQEGKSSYSLLEAIIKAISASLKTFPSGPASVNVIVEGYEFDGEEYVAKVRVIVMPHNLDIDNIYHENREDRDERQMEAENVASGFMAAAHHIEQYDSEYDHALNIIQAEIASKIELSHEAKVTLSTTDEIHDILRKEAKEQQMKKENTLDFQTLDLGGGGSSSAQIDEAA